MQHKWRMNHKPSTLRGSFHAVRSFLTFYVSSGKSHLQEIVNDNLEAFVEYEQDRGPQSLNGQDTAKTHLGVLAVSKRTGHHLVRAFLSARSNSELLIFCPGPFAPGDVRKLIGAIKENS